VPTTNIANWNFQDEHVQQELAGGDFVNAASILFAAGPPAIRFAGGTGTDMSEQERATREDLNEVAYPLGVLENVGIGQNKQLQRLFEIGSKRSYFITGRNVGQVNMARVLYNGPSLLRALYAYFPATKINTSVGQLLAAGAGRAGKAAPEIDSNPGYADFFINLDSDLFDQPFGWLVLILDSDGEPYGGVYLEQMYVQAHQFTINSTSVIVAEGATAQFDRLVPVDVGAVARSIAESLEERDTFGDFGS